MTTWEIIGSASAIITIGGAVLGIVTYRNKRRKEKTHNEKIDRIEQNTSEHVEQYQVAQELKKKEIDQQAIQRRNSIAPVLFINVYQPAQTFLNSEPKTIMFWIETRRNAAIIESVSVPSEDFILRAGGAQGHIIEGDGHLELRVDYIGEGDANTKDLCFEIIYQDTDGNRYKIELSGNRKYVLSRPELIIE